MECEAVHLAGDLTRAESVVRGKLLEALATLAKTVGMRLSPMSQDATLPVDSTEDARLVARDVEHRGDRATRRFHRLAILCEAEVVDEQRLQSAEMSGMQTADGDVEPYVPAVNESLVSTSATRALFSEHARAELLARGLRIDSMSGIRQPVSEDGEQYVPLMLPAMPARREDGTRPDWPLA